MEDHRVEGFLNDGVLYDLTCTAVAVEQVRQAWDSGRRPPPKLYLLDCTFEPTVFGLLLQLIAQYSGTNKVNSLSICNHLTSCPTNGFDTIASCLPPHSLEILNILDNSIDLTLDDALIDRVLSITDLFLRVGYTCVLRASRLGHFLEATIYPIEIVIHTMPFLVQFARSLTSLQQIELCFAGEGSAKWWASHALSFLGLGHKNLKKVILWEISVTEENNGDVVRLGKLLANHPTLEVLSLHYLYKGTPMPLERFLFPLLQDNALGRPLKLELNGELAREGMKQFVLQLATPNRLERLVVPYFPSLTMEWLNTLKTNCTLREISFCTNDFPTEEVRSPEMEHILSLVRRNDLLYKTRLLLSSDPLQQAPTIAAMVGILARFAAFPKRDAQRQKWLSAAYNVVRVGFVEKNGLLNGHVTPVMLE